MIIHHYIDTSEYTSVKFSSNSDNTLYFNGGSTNVYVGTPDVLYNDFAVIKHIGTYTHGAINSNPNIELDAVPTANSGNLMTSGNIKSALDNNQRIFYAVTETASATAVKEFIIPNFPTEIINGVKTPLKGTTIIVRQASGQDLRNNEQLKFKINDGGEFAIWYRNSEFTQGTTNGNVYGYTNCYYVFSFDGTYWVHIGKSFDADTTYGAGTGLKKNNSNQFSLNVPRVAKSANSLPGTNTAIIEEYTAGANYDLPLNYWFHILTFEGNDSNYATQLALGMNTNAAYYRNYNNGVWQSWLRIDNPTMDSTPTAGNTSNVVSSAGIKSYVDNAVATKSNVVIRQWVTQ